ncbi:DUF1995 family protein [Thermoleptolyngbya oregonensis NK1-22]|uniref:DUF1995 family protein n=1 Tax=Thermoleptolyngbya oregonensis NK1-22 TaxID=2547457 RepID=A0AA97BC68_9CYAN|nr:DUF1995 family protein [Thermoleptolyngbya oregonensis]WOB42281.1 DUF1995 family protein [Thermoleptolyngbya oregonensis NK1-22]
MTQLPDSLDEAIAQAVQSTEAAIADGLTRLQVELLFPELPLMPVAQAFVAGFTERGSGLRVFFPDAGAAALARRDWGEVPYAVRGIEDVKTEIQPEETLILFIQPSSVEVGKVEALCQQAGDRPVVFFNPRLEDVATIGIGYAGRQLRDRFLNQFLPCYSIRPLENAAVFRAYPALWQVWLEQDETYQLVAEEAQRPAGDALDTILLRAMGQEPSSPVPNRGVFAELQRFLRALSQ